MKSETKAMAAHAYDLRQDVLDIIVNGGGNQTDNIIDFAPAGGGYYVDASQTSVNEFGSTVYVPIPWGEPVDPPVDNPLSRAVPYRCRLGLQK